MKLLIATILLPCIVFSQPQNIYSFPVDSATGKISFSGIVEKPGISKDQIYSRSKIWVAQIFNSAKDVINMDDREAGILKLKANISKNNDTGMVKYKDVLYFDCFIYVKDGRYKYLFCNLEHAIVVDGDVSKTPLEKPLFIDPANKDQMQYFDYRKKWSERIKQDIDGMAASLDKAISTKSPSEF